MKKYFLFLLLLIVTSCSTVSKSNYIVSVSNGVIGVKMPIYIHLVDSLSLTDDIVSQVVSINPKTDIKCTIANGSTIVITPVKRFEYDTKYEVTLDLNKVTKGAEKGHYLFEVSTANPNYTFNDNTLTMEDEYFYLNGDILTSDYVDNDYIEKNFKMSGSELPIKWAHSENGMLHSYKIDKIEQKDSEYTIKLDRKYHQSNELEVIIPAKRDYSIMSCTVIPDPLQIVVTFSSMIKANQNFSELVTLSKDLKFNVVANKLIIYPSEYVVGTHKLTISGLLENSAGKRLPESEYTYDVTFPEIEPSIKFISNGSILPSSNDMNILFQSVNYAKARVRVKKIYANNILQFFQMNAYNGMNNMEYVAAVVKDTVIILDQSNSPKLRFANNYALNISDLITADKGAIYRIELRGVDPLTAEKETYDSDYYFGDYESYEGRSRNILQSDLGLIAKGDENGNMSVYTTNLLTAKPEMESVITIYNIVNQQIASGLTDGYGKVEFKGIKGVPFIVVAEKDGNRSYLKVENGLSLSLSNFDVAGQNVSSGIKGYIFGERGVWRPGDDIYLTFMVVSKGEALPENHPVKMEFRNPQGQLVSETVKTGSKDGIYCFRLKTSADASTGNWEATANFGGDIFKKTIKIETIKPNRLKIDFRLNDTPALPADNIMADVNAKWLHGAIAKDMKVKINVELSKTKTEFKDYKEYIFDDNSRTYSSEEKELFSAVTNQNGDAKMQGQIGGLAGNSPGMLNGKFTVKVFEPSGDFSIDQYATKVSPYDTYVGVWVKEQENNWGDKYLNIKSNHNFNFVAVDNNGKLRNIDRVKVELYKMTWNWWWDADLEGAMSSYAQNSYNKPYQTIFVSMSGGRGTMSFHCNTNEWGRYLIRVTDLAGGHSAMKMFYVDEEYGRNSNGETESATRLSITKNKDRYNIGEEAVLTIPSSKGAKALVSLESGNTMLSSYWMDCEDGKTTITIPLKEGMAPNIYAHITMVQPHNNTLNDAPIRMYGVIKINVEDKDTRLTPVIKVAEKIRPETEFNLTVSEKNGVAMSYVVAIVDDGLLDLTRFKTPNPWNHFNADEALGVRTWDMFDNVIGAYGGRIEQLFAIGGDDELNISGVTKAERFKPVVYFIEAQKLGRGKSNTHKIKLPPYFGSVRVMVIASNGKAQGSADKTVEVKKPLMVQMTLPRVVSTGEEITLPVTIFAMEEKVGRVDVALENSDLFTVVGERSKSVTLNSRGEEMVFFTLKVGNKTGVGKLSVKASGKGDTSTGAIEIAVRNPNPPTTYSKSILINGGGSNTLDFPYKSGSAIVELSTIPAIDLSRRLDYLTSYPHGCIEQIVSGAFPQLYITDIMDCDSQRTQQMEYNVKSTLERLSRYQLSNGGFAYWSGMQDISPWGTIYAGHFMIEAAKRGYTVNSSMKNNWKKYVSKQRFDNDTEQGYALYVLALNGTPERGAMNIMRENKALTTEAALFLAGAYTLDNKANISKEILQSINTTTTNQSPFNPTFGSREREMAVLLTLYNVLGEREKAFGVVNSLAKILNNKEQWMSTQSVAWSLNSIAGYVSQNRGNGIDMSVNGEVAQSPKAFAEKRISTNGSPIKLVNNGKGTTYAVVSTKYVPEKGEEVAKSNGLTMNVTYSDFNDKVLDPSKIATGTDFFVDVTIQNISDYENYTNLALTHIFPSGWEISRNQSSDGVTRRDVRDDRVLTYFDIKRGEQKRIRTKVTATYKGKFYLPSVYCEAMYNGLVNVSTKGMWTEIN